MVVSVFEGVRADFLSARACRIRGQIHPDPDGSELTDYAGEGDASMTRAGPAPTV